MQLINYILHVEYRGLAWFGTIHNEKTKKKQQQFISIVNKSTHKKKRKRIAHTNVVMTKLIIIKLNNKYSNGCLFNGHHYGQQQNMIRVEFKPYLNVNNVNSMNIFSRKVAFLPGHDFPTLTPD